MFVARKSPDTTCTYHHMRHYHRHHKIHLELWSGVERSKWNSCFFEHTKHFLTLARAGNFSCCSCASAGCDGYRSEMTKCYSLIKSARRCSNPLILPWYEHNDEILDEMYRGRALLLS